MTLLLQTVLGQINETLELCAGNLVATQLATDFEASTENGKVVFRKTSPEKPENSFQIGGKDACKVILSFAHTASFF